MRKIVFIIVVCFQFGILNGQNIVQNQKEDYEYFLDFFTSGDIKVHKKALTYINDNWAEHFEILAIESLYFLRR